MKTLFVVLLASLAALSLAQQANIIVNKTQNAYNFTDDLAKAVMQATPSILIQSIQNASYLTTTVYNISAVGFYLLSSPTNYTQNSSNSSIITGYNASFLFTLSYNFTNTQTNVSGFGSAGVYSNTTNFSVSVGNTADLKPFQNCTDLTLDFSNFTAINNNSANSSNSENLNISAALDISAPVFVVPAIKNAIFAACLANYNTPTINQYNAYPQYSYTLNRGFTFNNSYNVTVFPNLTTLALVNGTINQAGYTNISPSTTVNFNSTKPKQIAYSSAMFQNYLQYAYDNSWTVASFDRDATPLKTFDFSVNDVSNVVPSILSNTTVNTFVEFTCTPESVTNISFNGSLNQALANINFTCNVNVIGSSVSLLNVTLQGTLGLIPTITNSGNINFVVGSATYLSGSATATGVTTGTFQYTLLEYYVSQGLLSLAGSPNNLLLSGIQLPWTNPVNIDYQFDNNWFYVSTY